MDPMAIAAMSVEMHQQQMAQQLDVAVLGKAMEMESSMMSEMVETMVDIDVSGMTGIGGIIDILA